MKYIFIILVIFLIGCSGKVPVENIVTTPVSFETIEQGSYSTLSERQSIVIDNAEEWKELWETMHANRQPLPELPQIDFKKEMVLAVFQGQQATGGYSIEVAKIVEDSNIVVGVIEKTPPPGAFVTQAITSPYHLVKIAKTKKDIIF